jgi:hypothetical protein
VRAWRCERKGHGLTAADTSSVLCQGKFQFPCSRARERVDSGEADPPPYGGGYDIIPTRTSYFAGAASATDCTDPFLLKSASKPSVAAGWTAGMSFTLTVGGEL